MWTVQQCECFFLQGGEFAGFGEGIFRLQLLQKVPAGLQSRCCDVAGGLEGAHGETGSCGIVVVAFADEEWRVVNAEVATGEIGRFCRSRSAAELLQPHVGWQIGIDRSQSGHDGAE